MAELTQQSPASSSAAPCRDIWQEAAAYRAAQHAALGRTSVEHSPASSRRWYVALVSAIGEALTGDPRAACIRVIALAAGWIDAMDRANT